MTRNRNFMIYLSMNFVLILFLSTLRFDPSTENIIDISFQFDYRLSILVLIISLSLQIIALNISSRIMFHDPNVLMIYPEFDRPTNNLELQYYLDRLDRNELVDRILSFAEEFEIMLDEIYVTYTPIPNAYTLKIMYSKSILNINTNIFEILEPRESDSVILHELGHLKNQDSMLKLIYSSPSMFIHLAFVYIYFTIIVTIFYSVLFDFRLVEAATRIALLLLIYFSYRIYNSFINSYLIKAERAAELLADLFAAENIGSIPMINALIRLGQRVENIDILLAEFQKMEFLQRRSLTPEDSDRLIRILKKYPSDEMDDVYARLFAPYIYLYSEMIRLRDIYLIPLDDDTITNLAEQGVKNLHEQGIIAYDYPDDLTLSKISRHWSDFDINKDDYLDGTELDHFIRSLENEPNKFLFASEISINRYQREHPDFRRRILNIAENYPLGT